jgi:hypothetical protein
MLPSLVTHRPPEPTAEEYELLDRAATTGQVLSDEVDDLAAARLKFLRYRDSLPQLDVADLLERLEWRTQ